jgi:hypothetical protein
MRISRQAEAELPNFSSHEEARDYFKNTYGEQFVLVSSHVIDGTKVHFYALSLNPSVFKDGQKKIQQGEFVLGLEYLESYQSIEIFEDGQIHIIH